MVNSLKNKKNLIQVKTVVETVNDPKIMVSLWRDWKGIPKKRW